jgi:EmrB/QacA subfamily drug resistance transporter
MTTIGFKQAVPLANRRWHALAVLALVQFIILLDNTIVNVALPSIKRDLGFSGPGLAWVVNGYLLAAGGLLLLGGRLGDIAGRRRMFLAGTVVFAVASLVSGLSPTAEVLVTGRFLQGVGEALASPAALSMIALLFPSGPDRAKAMGLWGGLAGIGATTGLLLSGALTEYASWRWLFYFNIPVAVLALVLLPRVVAESRPQAAGRRADVPAAVLVTGGFVGLVYATLQAATSNWTDSAVLVPAALGLGALAGFVLLEARSEQPLVPMRFFTNRVRVSANLASVLMTSSMIGMLVLLTLYMQDVLGYSPIEAGLAYLPFSAGFLAGALASGPLTTRIGGRLTLVTAFLVGAVGMGLAGRLPVEAVYSADLLPAMLVLSTGLGIGLPALQNMAMHGISEADAGLGSGVQTAAQALANALGVAMFVTIALRRAATLAAAGEPALTAITGGYQAAFLTGAGLLVAGVVVVTIALGRVPTATSGRDASSGRAADSGRRVTPM